MMLSEISEDHPTAASGAIRRQRLQKAVRSYCDVTMARLREDVRKLRFWRAIISEFVGSLFLVLIGCGSYTVSYPEHPITVKVTIRSATLKIFRKTQKNSTYFAIPTHVF
jgi:hypothetical protein